MLQSLNFFRSGKNNQNFVQSENPKNVTSRSQISVEEVQETIRIINSAVDNAFNLELSTRSKIQKVIDFLKHKNLNEILNSSNTNKKNIDAIKGFINSIIETVNKSKNKKDNCELYTELAETITLLQKIEQLLYNYKRKKSLNSIKTKQLQALVYYLDIALDSILQEKPNIIFSRQLRRDIKRLVTRHEHPYSWFFINRFHDTRRSESVPLKVLYGLITSLTISGGFFLIITVTFYGVFIFGEKENATIRSIKKLEKELATAIVGSINADDEGTNKNSKDISDSDQNLGSAPLLGYTINQVVDQRFAQSRIQTIQAQLRELRNLRVKELGILYVANQVALVVFAGTLGSIISILFRIEEFQAKQYRDPVMPILLGAFKPVIGASFALLIFAFLNSGIITIHPIHDQNSRSEPEQSSSSNNFPIESKTFFIFVIAFVAGFSERLAKDTIYKIENTFGNNNQESQNSITLEANKSNTIQHKSIVDIKKASLTNEVSSSNLESEN